MSNSAIDFALITALPLEREALLRHLDGFVPLQEGADPFTYYRGQITFASKPGSYEVVVIALLGMGDNEAAVGTMQALHRWKPANVLMLGIGGGIPGKVVLGDVVIADSVFYYELAKLTPEGEELRPQQFITDRLLFSRARDFDKLDWKQQIKVARPIALSTGSSTPAVRSGPIASGEKVFKNAVQRDQLLQHNPKLVAFAMEGAGVAQAAVTHEVRPRFLEVRGICDYGDDKKNDDWQLYVAEAVASFTVELLRECPVDPQPRLLLDEGHTTTGGGATNPATGHSTHRTTQASGNRSVAIGGDTKGTTIITGDHNKIE